MSKTVLNTLEDLGQSVWLDNIDRAMFRSGALSDKIKQGLLGMTSNPSIFDKSISQSSEYDEAILALAARGTSTFEIYDALTIEDIIQAADIFLPVYERTAARDGYVSLEVNPLLAYKTKETVEEARRLSAAVNRPNLMIKVPATDEGLIAVSELIAAGINVNVTLIFSLSQYRDTLAAYVSGLERLVAGGGDASRVHSVASVFVSRIDTVVDAALSKLCESERTGEDAGPIGSFAGRAALANSRVIYSQFRQNIATEEFLTLKKKGANIQRVLWGSTGTKNPSYSDVKYVDELIGPDTVNTIPAATLAAYLDHGNPQIRLSPCADDESALLAELKSIGIDVDQVCADLLKKGVVAFENSFKSLLEHLEHKTDQLISS